MQKGIVDYIDTTFPMTNAPFKGSLQKMLSTKDSVFHEPYIAVRLPFRTAENMPDCFEAIEQSYKPYVHQDKAFDRLIKEGGKSTLIATGTGSGKTECFLYPILEYCYQHRGEKGIKALIIYPMNALASDQARRIAKEIYKSDKLRGNVTAGMYVGGREKVPAYGMEEERVITDHETMLANPPDILLTNYKMLDYLLVRPKDAVLWKDNTPDTLKFIAVDELHTFDGAQGTDLACLIRRLKNRLGAEKGKACCIGTSATMGSEESAADILAYASSVFDEEFDKNAVITEDRLSPKEYFADWDVLNFDFPDNNQATMLEGLVAQDDETSYLNFAVKCWFSDFNYNVMTPEGRIALGNCLKQHSFVQALLFAMDGKFCQAEELVELLKRLFPELQDNDKAATIIYSIMALISHARIGVADNLRPFLNVQVQLWTRELRRLLARVGENVDYAIAHDLNAQQARQYLPVVNCRDCGATGWVTLINERGFANMTNLEVFYNKFFQADPEVAMLYPIPHSNKITGMAPAKICPSCLHVERTSMTRVHCEECGSDLIEVQYPAPLETVGSSHKQYVCSCCGSRRGISLMGLRGATEISAIMSQLFASKFNDDKKTLAFSDSVQDAAHKAGFFNSRTWKSGLRGAIQQYVNHGGDRQNLAQFTKGFIDYWHNEYKDHLEDYISLFIAPNMVWRKAFEKMKQQRKLFGTQEELELLATVDKRLAYEIMLEYGVTGKIGRTLEKSGCSVLSFDNGQIERIAAYVQEQAINELGILTKTPLAKIQSMVMGYFNLVRSAGAFDDRIFDKMLAEKGKTYHISADRIWWMPGRQSGRNTPHLLMLGYDRSASKEGLESIDSHRYLAWIDKCLDLDFQRETDCNDICRYIVEGAVAEKLLVEMPSALNAKVYGLNKEMVFVSKRVKQMVCQGCGSTYAVSAENAAVINSMPCYRRVCKSEVKANNSVALDYYGKLYSSGDLFRINAREHTGLLQRDDRERLEHDFKADKASRKCWDPNVLSCTPTLEMGIDIGDLSTVILCSMPPAQAQFLQRVGRAGRKDGNALTLAVANAKEHDLYFYAEPKEMIDGSVATPKIFLKATAVLERQFVAFAMDKWVKSGIDEDAVPASIGIILRSLETRPKDVFPFNFLSYVQQNLTRLTQNFIDMFAGQLDSYAENTIKKYALGEGTEDSPMHVKLLHTFNEQQKQIDGLNKDIKDIKAAIKDLKEQPEDSTFVDDINELEKEKRALAQVIAEIKKKNVFNFLSDEGLLPNYAFPEAGITLKAILYRGEEKEDGKEDKDKEPIIYEYNRAASAAISEFAPNNSFYAGGRKHKIDRVDITNSQPANWRLCPNCSFIELYDPQKHVASCPRCGSIAWADSGQVREMLQVQMVYSTGDYQKSLIDDESDNRTNVFYNKKLLVDVDENVDIECAYRMDNEDFSFGYEFVRKASIKEINFGESDKQGPKLTVAGDEQVRKGFRICKYCGKIQSGDAKGNHTSYCITKKRKDFLAGACDDCIFLFRKFETEALRILIPSTTEDSTSIKKESFVAAFMLGMKEYFGNVDHLRATVSEVPVPDAAYRKQYLVIYDSVPGGTGYLKQLMNEKDAFIDVLEKSLEVLERCSCKNDSNKDGCYHCLYAYRQSSNIGSISRASAIRMLKSILKGKNNVQKINKLGDIPVNTLFDSELEALFVEAFNHMNNGDRVVKITPDIVNNKEGYRLSVNDERWTIEPQVILGSGERIAPMSKPDFVIRPIGISDKLPVAVFTDGFTYHKDSADEDTLKREGIRRSGKYIVWNLSYHDVKQVTADQGDYFTNTLNYEKMPSKKAMYEGIVSTLQADSIKPIKTGPFELLVQYLGCKDATTLFSIVAGAYSLTLLDKSKMTVKLAYDGFVREFNTCLDAANLDMMELPFKKLIFGDWQPGDGNVHLYSGIGMEDFAKQKARAQARVIAVLNDEEGSKADSYQADWNGFWHFFNVMQFLPSFVAVTKKGLASQCYLSLNTKYTQAAVVTAGMDSPWNSVIEEELFDEDAIKFAKLLREAELPVPEIGYELQDDNGGVIAVLELAWIDQKLCYITEDQSEFADTIEGLGWTITDDVNVVKERLSGGNQ